MDKHIEMDTLEAKQAKQRASVKWLLSKVFNNRVPDNLKEPFYQDHEGQLHLKPQIVVGMGNASLYCQTLSNLFSDPNYQSLNHWSILQTLTRKGVIIPEMPDMPLTETVLIQTNPLRINAHMSVIEALMILYAKEVTSGDRVSVALGRITGGSLPAGAQNHETSLLLWVSHACAAVKKRIDQEIECGATDDEGVRLQCPNIPPIREYKDLCDGICLAYLISYYCPKVVPWTCVRVNYLPTVEDSIHNVLLVSNFSQKYLPYSVFHMTPEDITYMRGSMKQNLVVLLGDLFNLFEIHPAKCVFYPEMEQSSAINNRSAPITNEHGIAHRRGVTCQPVTPIPDLRSGLDSPTNSPSGRPPFQVVRSPSASTMRKHTPPKDVDSVGSDEGFVVHRGRGVPTLSSVHEPLVPARLRQAKEKTNVDSKAEERGDTVAAGRPSNWENSRRSSFAGRRSRRNSLSEDSQLTIENFGGSQDQINLIGRPPERERERKISNTSIHMEPAIAIRSSVADARGSIQLGYETDSGSEKQDRETEKIDLQRQASMDNVALRSMIHSKEKDVPDGDITMTKIQPIQQSVATELLYGNEDDVTKRKTSFATLPNTTTWQQQSANVQHTENALAGDENRSIADATKLSTIRLKLEEKRRNIEQEKRKMEAAMSKQQQKVGKAAFLQAINKGKVQTPADGESNDLHNKITDSGKPERPCSLQDIPDMETKWSDDHMEPKKTPDIDLDVDQYHQSIAMLNTSLYDIQADIQRLANQRTQIQAQQIQAQQLMQAQQIANMLNQQYGSQHNLSSGYRTIQQNFGSTPHISQQYGSPNNYSLRPSSRDSPQMTQYLTEQNQYATQSYQSPLTQQQQQQHQQQQQQPQIFSPANQSQNQYINDNGQYIRNDNNNQYGSQNPNQYVETNQYLSNQYINRDPQQQQQLYRRDQDPEPINHYQNREQQFSQSQRDLSGQQSSQFYLHDASVPSVQPTPPQRRTWAQSAASNQQLPLDINAWSQNAPKVDTRTWKSPHQNSNNGGGFVLHQNGGGDYDHREQSYQNLFPVHSSPQHNRSQSQFSPMVNKHSEKETRMPLSPSIDDMAPQSISFIGDEDSVDPMHLNNINQPNMHHQNRENDELSMHLGKLHISSGSRTYRIPSPTRPVLNQNSFQDPQEDVQEKGFYISFDNEQPKRPKPPLRAKRSPKKERSIDDKLDQMNQLEKDLDTVRLGLDKHNQIGDNENTSRNINEEPIMTKRHHIQESAERKHMNEMLSNFDRRHLEDVTNHQPQQINNSSHSSNYTNNINNNNNNSNENKPKDNKTIIIGSELSNLDPDSVDEMERKKEKIMLLSLQRRQQQEEAKARKEIESMQRREREREKEDEKVRKREEQASKRAAILEAYKLKKAIDEAEREGKVLDQKDLMMLQKQQPIMSQAKLRAQKVTRPRPKTIHVETGSVDLSEASSLASRGKKGSSSNLTGLGSLSSNSMRRDYYRGSQDSLAIRESPDEYPSTSSTPLGRKGSYKTVREPTIERGRTLSRISVAKGSGLNFRGRKSNSLMNLCDTDSGLGRATPPRRAPSPGMGPPGRHLPSPSGPGSLPPGLMTKRRGYDDGSSDISSAASSMMEYNGPKLYKQPATKSNRGIILNAVEYCVFPGAVNRDAKQKVLEKIARSEAKHFLILFRDAGCQFRAIYSYWPENETVLKLFGTGPTQVDDVMFDKFFKYNSGGKCFSQIHTKHLTVTIDAFTIHNSLWQGKKATNLPSKKDMALVI